MVPVSKPTTMEPSKCFGASGARNRLQPAAEDIVISGMSGKFPKSKNVAEFSHNLYNKVGVRALLATPNDVKKTKETAKLQITAAN